MMRNLLRIGVPLALLLLTTSVTVSAQDLKGILGSVVNQVVGKATTQERLVGNWKYVRPDCKLKGDNILAQAGSVLAEKAVVEQMETMCKKVGISAGKFSCEFRADGTFLFIILGKSTEGTYTFDPETKNVELTMRFGITFNAEVVMAARGNSLSLLFEADKIISLLKTISRLATKKSSNSTLATIGLLAEQYKGLQLGFEFEKQ
ncbi:MAG: DUF4923 family protein [Phocaeicola sp.]